PLVRAPARDKGFCPARRKGFADRVMRNDPGRIRRRPRESQGMMEGRRYAPRMAAPLSVRRFSRVSLARSAAIVASLAALFCVFAARAAADPVIAAAGGLASSPASE